MQKPTQIDSDFYVRLAQDGLAAIKVEDAANSHRLYRLDVIFGSSSGAPTKCGVDVECGASRAEIAAGLRSLADLLCKI